MSYWGWKPYVSAAERRRKAEAAAIKARKAGANLAPIPPSRGAIARTFWGKAWCDNLERYSDYVNRLPRGRTYVRNGSVIDLAIGPGQVRAQVMGSRLYRVDVRVAAVAEEHWKAIGAACAGSIDSMVELLQGKFSQSVMQRLCRPGDGLFPAPKEVEFSCSCPDWASMCKHVAAVLYGVGARLDQRPELLFDLRRVDGSDLLAQAGSGLARPRKAPSQARMLDESALGDVFGIEMAEAASPTKAANPAARRDKKSGAGAVEPASKITVRRSARSPSSARIDVKAKVASTVAPRKTAKSKAPATVRARAGARTDAPQPRASTRKARTSRAAALEKQSPKRKARA